MGETRDGKHVQAVGVHLLLLVHVLVDELISLLVSTGTIPVCEVT